MRYKNPIRLTKILVEMLYISKRKCPSQICPLLQITVSFSHIGDQGWQPSSQINYPLWSADSRKVEIVLVWNQLNHSKIQENQWMPLFLNVVGLGAVKVGSECMGFLPFLSILSRLASYVSYDGSFLALILCKQSCIKNSELKIELNWIDSLLIWLLHYFMAASSLSKNS